MAIKMDADEKAGFAILCEVIPEDLAESIIKARQKKKLIFTPRIAKRLIEQYREFGNPEQAAEIHVSKGWIDFRCDWAKKESRFTDQNHPTPRLSANYGNAPPEPIPEVVTAEEMERRRQMVARLRQQGVLRA
jgi:hypothetical protein